MFGIKNIRRIQERKRQNRAMDASGRRREPYYAGEVIGSGGPGYLGNRQLHPSLRIMPSSWLYGQGGMPDRLFPDGSARPGFGPPSGPGGKFLMRKAITLSVVCDLMMLC